jgi:hypothetical protein
MRSAARSTIAFAKWVMTSQGGRTSLTVTAPRRTWTANRMAARSAGFRSVGSLRCRRSATAATANTRMLTRAAAQR